MPRAVRYLWLSITSLVTTVVVCVILQPDGVLSHAGLSYFGNFGRTLIPYSIGMVATAYFLLRACFTLGSPHGLISRSFRYGLEGIAIGLLGIVATPSLSPLHFIRDVHVAFGIIIFITQAVLSLRYLIRVRGGAADWALLVLQLFAIVIVGLSTGRVGLLDWMLPAQLLAVVSFFALLIRAVNHATSHAKVSV